ncbi:hypothetical protein INS49_005877 [Diaporthe citri]|uniref:uncharacterized protein n=1 Tax=Diaporthe citri TaxID=83186 RepID=UPI001C81EFED|nr:uncharacterized protein INS49_005877 [Diaporthe citri]KAG6364278.1 hypothetical protein INS49_005877 [Diaporthe citri]
MPKKEAEDEIAAQGNSDIHWTTSVWSASDKSKGKKSSWIQGPRYQGHVSESRVLLTNEDSRRICRRIDKRILVILVLDKMVVGHGAILGLQADLALMGNRFYWVVTIALIAQLTASFLAQDEQFMAIERLRANQAASDAREVRWGQVKEAVKDVKTCLFFIMSLGNSLGSQVPRTFGPLILKRLGYDNYTTLLLNMPFGALQYIVILGVSWLAVKFRWKSLTLGSSLVPVIIGLVILFVLPQGSTNTAVLLIGYHLFAFIFGCNSLILSWIMANTAGQTKKSITLSLYSAASSTGIALGPLLFKSSDAPRYDTALKITLGVYIGISWAVIVQVVNLVLLNGAQEKRRLAHEKPATLHDHSMREKYVDITVDNEHHVGNFAFADLTDKQNDEFVYIC